MDNINLQQGSNFTQWGPRLRAWPLTGKVWVTMIIVMMSLGLIVALGQIVVHDIIPTFQDGDKHLSMNHGESETHSDMRGDLFSDTRLKKKFALLPNRRVYLCFEVYPHSHFRYERNLYSHGNSCSFSRR